MKNIVVLYQDRKHRSNHLEKSFKYELYKKQKKCMKAIKNEHFHSRQMVQWSFFITCVHPEMRIFIQDQGMQRKLSEADG